MSERLLIKSTRMRIHVAAEQTTTERRVNHANYSTEIIKISLQLRLYLLRLTSRPEIIFDTFRRFC